MKAGCDGSIVQRGGKDTSDTHIGSGCAAAPPENKLFAEDEAETADAAALISG